MGMLLPDTGYGAFESTTLRDITVNGYRIIQCFLLILLALESVLLEMKYQVFSGSGFLQSSPLNSPFEKILFMGLIFSAFALLYIAATTVFKKLLQLALPRFTKPAFTAASLFIFIYGLSLMMHYKLHAYVADHVDQKVIQAIAGNSLENAIVYVKDEILVLLLPVLGFWGLFIVLIKRITPESGVSYIQPHALLSRKRLFIGSAILFAVIAISSSHAVTLNAKRSMAFSILLKTGHTLTDWDRDGSSLLSTPSDPAPFDGQLYWGAIDIPGNNIDENGLGGDLPSAGKQPPVTEEYPIADTYKHLLIIVSESTRADILDKQIEGTYVAPNLRALAASGSSVKQAYSHAGFTANSLYTLFSGHFLTKENSPSIFQKARSNGFEISIISGQDESWGDLDTRLGTRETANFFYDPQADPEKRVYPSTLPSSIKLSDATIVETFRNRLQTIDPNKRQLFYLNLQSGHFPYHHKYMDLKFTDESIPRSSINNDNKEWLANTYWNAMSYMDTHLGKAIEALENRGILSETLIVFLGDHGEELFDEGFLGHGHNINKEQLQIPLVLSAPGLDFTAPIGLSDVSRWLFQYIEPSDHIARKYGHCVFMHTGYLASPAQIGQVCKGQPNMQSYTIIFDEFRGAASTDNIDTLKRTLIHKWERILLRETAQ